MPLESKTGVLPDLFPVLRDHTIGNVRSLVARGAGRRRLRAARRAPADAPLRAGGRDRDLRRARDHAQRAAQLDEDRPGRRRRSRSSPRRRACCQATVGALIAIAVAFAYQRSRLGRLLRATREDAAAAQAAGVNVHRQRLWAFTLSGALAGFAGGLLVHLLGSITTEQVYLELTFLTLAMLVIGGVASLWGAVLGALVVSGARLVPERGRGAAIRRRRSTCPTGTRLIVLGALMALVLILRPSGLHRRG